MTSNTFGLFSTISFLRFLLISLCFRRMRPHSPPVVLEHDVPFCFLLAVTLIHLEGFVVVLDVRLQQYARTHACLVLGVETRALGSLPRESPPRLSLHHLI